MQHSIGLRLQCMMRLIPVLHSFSCNLLIILCNRKQCQTCLLAYTPLCICTINILTSSTVLISYCRSKSSSILHHHHNPRISGRNSKAWLLSLTRFSSSTDCPPYLGGTTDPNPDLIHYNPNRQTAIALGVLSLVLASSGVVMLDTEYHEVLRDILFNHYRHMPYLPPL